MTLHQALFVKWLRVRQGGSWRYVAAKFKQRYEDKLPFKDEFLTFGGNQIDGMFLCKEAMNILTETGKEWVD